MTFRDASAVLERVAALEQENAELRAELDALKAEMEELREAIRAALASEHDAPQAQADSGPPVLLIDKMRAFVKKLNEPYEP